MQTSILFEAKMEKGSKVLHRLTGETYTIKSIYENVATCYLPKPYHFLGMVYIDVCVCSIENLTIVN